MLNDSVKLNSFTKKYASKTACNNIDFVAGPCSVTGLLGPNGAGKSTLLKAICGHIYPTAGSLSVCGFSMPEEIKRITGYVPEVPELEEKLCVKETLLLESSLYLPKEQVKDAVDFAVEFCNLEDTLTSRVGRLSKGYKQRVSLAKALCIKPRVLVLDEFSAGLDPSQTVDLRNKIKKLSACTTIIFSTHHIDEAVSLCNGIYILNKGTIASHGTAEQIIKGCGCSNLEEAFIALTKKEAGSE